MALALLTLAAPGARAATIDADTPQTLSAALTALSARSGVDIISTEAGLDRIRVRPVAPQGSVAATLDRLLAGTGFQAVVVDRNSFRIVRAARPEPRPEARKRPPLPAAEPTDIIVTASKQHISLLRYPGSITVVGGLDRRAASDTVADLDDVARAAPILQNTELGAGRNKIFIRGIADSSFNGATQSTATVYFGDVQLGYSGPQPALNTYDIARIEVMEGPQGTLYGAGAIGGIIRMSPNPVDLANRHASLAAGSTMLAGGALGYDASGMINLPVITDHVGLRLVGYASRDGGYIDDTYRKLKNVNETDTVGGRAALRIDPGDGWSVDAGLLGQAIDARDAPYADAAVGPIARRSALPQPFHNDILAGRVVITKNWDSGLQLVSATGLVTRHASDVFDATKISSKAILTAYENDESNLLVTQEMRLSRSVPAGPSWVVGAAFLYDRDMQSRRLGPVDDPIELIGVTNVTQSGSVFAELTLPVTPALSITFGGRGTAARTDGEPSAQPRAANFVRGRSTRRFDPTLALSWRLAPGLAAYARVQSGYRTGGLAVARGVGRVADFQSDSIYVGEIGLRHERSGVTGLAFSTSASFARWNNIQADLFNRFGQPFTSNIGNADIYTLEADTEWVPLPGLRAALAFLYTQNRVDGAIAASSTTSNQRLPETPPLAATLDISYRWTLGSGEIRVGGTARYVGRSVLGPGNVLDISQGRYAVVSLSGGWQRGAFDASLTIDNLTNRNDNIFALGNPITYAVRDQTTPLRPRSVRAGIGWHW